MFTNADTPFFMEDILRAEWRGMTPMQKLMALVIEYRKCVLFFMLVLCVVTCFIEPAFYFYAAAGISVVLCTAVKVYKKRCREHIVLYDENDEEWVIYSTYPGVAAEEFASLVDSFANVKRLERELSELKEDEFQSLDKKSYVQKLMNNLQQLKKELPQHLHSYQSQLDEQRHVLQQIVDLFG